MRSSLCPGGSFWLRATSLIASHQRACGGRDWQAGGRFHPGPSRLQLRLLHPSKMVTTLVAVFAVSCGLARAPCLGPEPCWYRIQPAPWWEKLLMSAQLCCDLPAPRSCPLSPGSLRGALVLPNRIFVFPRFCVCSW